MNAEALAEGAGVVAALPTDLATKVDYAEVISVDQITLRLRDGREVLWGSAEQSDGEGGGARGAARAGRRRAGLRRQRPGMPTT